MTQTAKICDGLTANLVESLLISHGINKILFTCKNNDYR